MSAFIGVVSSSVACVAYHVWVVLLRSLVVSLVVVLLSVLLMSLFLKFFPNVFYRDKPAGLCGAILSDKPNWVSSLVATDNAHYINPLPMTEFSKLAEIIERIFLLPPGEKGKPQSLQKHKK